MTSLQEFGYVVKCGKAKFAKECAGYILAAYEENAIAEEVKQEMLADAREIEELLNRERDLDNLIIAKNKKSTKAKLLESIPGIGAINASILSIKAMASYATAKDFAASLGLVPKQSSTGGNIKLGSISKQGDRYARTMLIQGARTVVMRSYKANSPKDELYDLVARLKKKGKKFNVICVAVANKLARIAYACSTHNIYYEAKK